MATVLVVDDEADLRTLLTTMLQIAGHQVIQAEGGEAALTVMAAGGIDIVLLDLMMPAMDGWAVLWDLHDRPSHPPVIVMSARPEYGPDHPPLGAVRYLQKPFAMETAVESIREVLAATA